MTKRKFELETKNRFSVLECDLTANEKCPDEIWEDMKKVYLESAEKVLGKKESKKSKPYVSEEIMQLSRDKRKARMNNKKEDYKRLKREIRFKIRKEKKEWLINECSKITAANEHRKSKELYQQIKKVKGTKIFVKNQCVKDKDGNTLTDSKEVLGRWQDYGKSLFSLDDRNTSNDDIVFPNENLEPEPLLDEVLSAINQLKSNKAPGLDNVPGELLKFSDDLSKKALHSLCCKIWSSGAWPSEWKLQEFVMLHKSGDPKNCGNYRTIALISHASKIMLIIILNRLRNKVDFELSECQAGYRSNRGTIDMLFVLQILIEKVRNTRDEAFITFIDYSKAFDSVIHQHLFKVLIDSNLRRPE